VPPAEEFFARPVDDSKSFAGTVFAHKRDNDGTIIETAIDQWNTWRDSVVGLETSAASIQPDDLVMLAPLKNIYAEYRLFVIGGMIATGSRYKLGSRVFYTPDIDPAVRDYAHERLAEYCPRDALCLDIAHIEGPRALQGHRDKLDFLGWLLRLRHERVR
jgi:hypothetical protein